MVWCLFQVILLFLLADFAAGVFHWAEDTLGDDDTPIWGYLFAAPNSVHHADPTAMTKIHWVVNNAPLFSFASLVVIGAWCVGLLTWQLFVFALFGAMTQQAHRFAHMPNLRLPAFVRFLQRFRILQDSRHHWGHHVAPHTHRYCVMTPWVNPVLDQTGFWRGMERILVPIFGAPRRADLAGKHWYRAHAVWVNNR